MSAESVTHLEEGGAALSAGDWAGAREAFRAALAVQESPEAKDGLASALWWLGDIGEALSCWEAAYAGYLRKDERVPAIIAAVGLSLFYDANIGNHAVAAGWGARAARLADAIDDPVLNGWVLLTKGATSQDVGQNQAWAREAHRLAAAAHDHDLELCALSALGAALIDEGRVEEGAALLDEALTGALSGEGDTLDTVVFTSCLLMQSCFRSADFTRILEWSRALEAFTKRYGCPYVNATCRAQYGAVLVAIGDWSRAEKELAAARRIAGDALPVVQAEALAFLADLRLAQGRVGEARRLVVGYEQHPVVVPVLAATLLADGEAALAEATVRRRLEASVGRNLENSRLQEVLGEARIVLGDPDAAVRLGRELLASGRKLRCAIMVARGERLLGRALMQLDPTEAIDHLESARMDFERLEMPWDRAHAGLLLAEAAFSHRPEAAIAEARTSQETFGALGATSKADDAAAWLRDHGVAVARPGSTGLGGLTRRERDVFSCVSEGLTNPEIAGLLYISRRTVEHHVASILSKLGLRNRTEIARFAARYAAKDAPTT